MADIMDVTVSPSQALFKLKIRNAGRARLISALGNETLVTSISNSKCYSDLGNEQVLVLCAGIFGAA